MAIWGINFWGQIDPQVFIRPFESQTGQPQGFERNPFGQKTLDPKITSTQEGRYIVTATNAITPHDLPYIPGFNEISVRLVDQNGENLQSAAIYVPEPTDREAPPGSMYEIVASHERDGNFLFSAIIPVEKLREKFSSLPPEQQRKVAEFIKKILNIDINGLLPKNTFIASQIDINQVEKLDLLNLPEFDYVPIDGEIAGLKITPLPNKGYVLMYYKDNQLEARTFQNGKFSQAQSLGAHGILKDAIYDTNSGQILAGFRQGPGSEFWDIAVIDPQTLSVARKLSFPRPTLQPDETRRKIDYMKLIPQKLGVNCLAGIGYQLKGETQTKDQVGSAVISGSADKISPLTSLAGEYYFHSAVPTPQGDILVGRVVSDETQGNTSKTIPKTQVLSASAFSQTVLPITTKGARIG